MQSVIFKDLGDMPYKEAWDYQTALHQALIDNKLQHRQVPFSDYRQDHYLLFVEHPPVYTLGRSGSMDNLLLNEQELREKGIDFFPINRGGDITFHGPGQLVGYPILDLERFFTDVHRYVRNIEEVIIRTMADYGLEGYRIKEYTGVWTDGRRLSGESRHAKVCAIGVHLSRWTTLHGWAFNVNTPLEYFDYIIPCGIADKDKQVTSMAQLLSAPLDMAMLKERVRRHFETVFECRLDM